MNKLSDEWVKQYKHVFDSIRNMVFIHDCEGNILMVNNEVVKYYGYSIEELLSMNITDIRKSDDFETIVKQLKGATTTNIE